jgi:hypothetical protein
VESRGFKVDIRAVYDRFSARKNLKEVDTANVEMARSDASIGKITKDRTKLFIENECVIDRMTFEVSVKKAPWSHAYKLLVYRMKLKSYNQITLVL